MAGAPDQYYNQSNPTVQANPMGGQQAPPQQVIGLGNYGVSNTEDDYRTFYVVKGEGVQPTPEEKHRQFQMTGVPHLWGVKLRWATEFNQVRHDIQTCYETNFVIRGPVVEVPLKKDLTQLYVYTPGGYLPLFDENDLDDKGNPKPLLFEDKEDQKNRMEKKQIEDGDLLSVDWAKKRAEGKRLTDDRGNHFSYCSLSMSGIGNHTGAGLQIYFNTLKWYGALFFIFTLLAIHPLALNSGGYQEDSWQNSTGFTRISFGNVALDPSNDSDVGAEAAWDVITIITAFVFLAVVSRKNFLIAADQNARNTTAADYAIMLKDLPPQTTKYDIIDYFSKAEFLTSFSGSKIDMVRANDRIPGPLIKDNCFTCVDVQDLVNHLAEYKKIKKRLRPLEASIESDSRELVLDSGMDQAKSAALNKKIEENEKTCEKHGETRQSKREI